ncbi:MAG: small subunit ribosomal protein S9 [Myxococcota bacterium]
MAEVTTATGKRKSSIARVRLTPGTGQITVNGRVCSEYFPRIALMNIVNEPLTDTDTLTTYDISANICGGGTTGQAGALRHGIARALEKIDPSRRLTLKQAGYLTRDARRKERKKYGQKGARARFQFSKR